MSLDKLPPGVYVVAVSGGVDSMVLLDLIRRQVDCRLVVAHVDHGIRADSQQDRKLVRAVSMSYNIPFEYVEARLDTSASEAEARQVRYNFLRRVCKKYNARAILTAHHRDDILETAIINCLRGTGWRGLSSLRSRADVIRPLLHVPKAELYAYALQQQLQWREDSTNSQQQYLRNYVRHNILASLPKQQQEKLYRYIVRQNELTPYIDDELVTWIQTHTSYYNRGVSLPRYQLVMLPDHVAHELLQMILRQQSGGSLPRPLIDRALLFCKVAKHSKVFQLSKRWHIRINHSDVIVERAPDMVS